jgi:predicted nucleotidyltransferase
MEPQATAEALPALGPEEAERVASVLSDAVEALDANEVPYLLMGGLAASHLGRLRATADIDLFVRQGDAGRALDALAGSGFETERTNPQWIFKAAKQGLTIDLIFWLRHGLSLDEEMLARAESMDLAGRAVRVMPPEDLIVVKASTHDEHTPRHWFDALGIIAGAELDWDYLLRRANHGARRVLALLVYAQSDDLIVPDHVIRSLVEAIYDEAAEG